MQKSQFVNFVIEQAIVNKKFPYIEKMEKQDIYHRKDFYYTPERAERVEQIIVQYLEQIKNVESEIERVKNLSVEELEEDRINEIQAILSAREKHYQIHIAPLEQRKKLVQDCMKNWYKTIQKEDTGKKLLKDFYPDEKLLKDFYKEVEKEISEEFEKNPTQEEIYQDVLEKLENFSPEEYRQDCIKQLSESLHEFHNSLDSIKTVREKGEAGEYDVFVDELFDTLKAALFN